MGSSQVQIQRREVPEIGYGGRRRLTAGGYGGGDFSGPDSEEGREVFDIGYGGRGRPTSHRGRKGMKEKQMIARGAANIVVRGFFPVGCAPVALTNFASNDTSKYDEFGCIIEVNKLSQLHNLKLQDAVKELQIRYPSVRISYGDTYSAFIEILRNAVSFGFDKDGVFKTCCGDGNNPYNLNVTRGCGTAGVSACPDPSKRLSWDGLHLTQQAYMFLADSLITNNLRDN